MDSIYQFFLSIFSLIIVYKLFNKLTIRLPPGPRSWPIIGNLYDVLKSNKFQCYTKWAQQYGPIFSIWFGSSLNVFVSNSELAREALKENDQHLANRYRSRSISKFNKGNNGLLWADYYDPHYVKLKHICMTELFSPKRLEALRPIREDEVTAMVDSIFKDCINSENRSKSLLVKKYLEAATFNNMTRLVFGKRFEDKNGVMSEVGLQIKAILAHGMNLVEPNKVIWLDHIPWLHWPLDNKELSKLRAQRDEFTKFIMEEHRVSCQKNGETTQNHFIDVLLTLQEEYQLSDDTIISLLWDMMIMSVDAIATSVEWAMAELIKNPRIQKKTQNEMDQEIGSNRIITEWDFSNLPYLRCIAKEALRIHPPIPFLLPHKANTHIKIGGYDIPKGSMVQVNIRALAHDPSIWKSPLEFRPERFIEEDVDIKGHDFRFIPFGAGRRVCPGAQFSLNLVTSMLAHLLHHFNWTPGDGLMPEDIDMRENVEVFAHMQTPLQAIVSPRLPNQLYNQKTVYGKDDSPNNPSQ